MTGRTRTVLVAGGAVGALAALFLTAALIPATAPIDFMARNLPPGADHPFGTDWLGRDLFIRTVHGLIISLGVGAVAAVASVVLAVVLGMAAAIGSHTGRNWLDTGVSLLVDTVMGTPHLVLLILISFALGGGYVGVVVAVGCTHFTRLARVVRAETSSLLASEYVAVSRSLGRSPLFIARAHLLPHLAGQVVIGALLLFPHAIMHSAGLTFLGFGLSPHTPAIGILLSEAMRHLTSGYWWLALAPGAALVGTICCFDLLAHALRKLVAPRTAHL